MIAVGREIVIGPLRIEHDQEHVRRCQPSARVAQPVCVIRGSLVATQAPRDHRHCQRRQCGEIPERTRRPSVRAVSGQALIATVPLPRPSSALAVREDAAPWFIAARNPDSAVSRNSRTKSPLDPLAGTAARKE